VKRLWYENAIRCHVEHVPFRGTMKFMFAQATRRWCLNFDASHVFMASSLSDNSQAHKDTRCYPHTMLRCRAANVRRNVGLLTSTKHLQVVNLKPVRSRMLLMRLCSKPQLHATAYRAAHACTKRELSASLHPACYETRKSVEVSISKLLLCT
jgi:hypothetical protein